MSSLITNPTPQFINPLFGNACADAKIYIGKVNTDALNPQNRQPVYMLQKSDQTTPVKTELPQPLVTNSAGVIVYDGLPVTPWVDGAYSITIIGYDGAQLFTSFYVDDPTYWLRLDLATEPKKTADGMHYDPDDDHGVNMVAGAAPILSPDFQGRPTAPTPPTGDSSTRIATTAFVTAEVQKIGDSGPLGTHSWYMGTSAPVSAVIMDGSQLSKTTYADVYAIIGDRVATANGMVPDSASFYIPDMRSRYWRGVDNGASRSSHAEMMKYYPDLVKSHTHPQDTGTLYAPPNKTGANQIQSDDSDIMVNFGGTTGATGDSETMPMSVAALPILWVTRASATVSAWWEDNVHLSARPVVHHYDETSGEYYASSPARPSPLEPGVWLTPAHATQLDLLTSKAGHILAFRDGGWVHDAELYQLRQQEKEEAQLTQERRNTLLMEKATKRKALNDWLIAQGAPATLDEMEDE